MLSAAEYRALNQKQPATASKPAGNGKTSEDPNEGHSAKEYAKILAARAEVVGPARLAWVNTTFGFPLHCRKYQLLDAGQAQQLDDLFHTITNSQP